MNYIRRKYVVSIMWEFTFLLVITGALCGFFIMKMSERFASLRANEVLININSMAKEAYTASKELDKKNSSVAKMDLNGCTIINKNNAWYMVCDLNSLTENEADQKNVLKKFQDFQKTSNGMMLSSESDFQELEISENQKYIITFLRFSSAKNISTAPNQSNENFVGFSNSKPEKKFFRNL